MAPFCAWLQHSTQVMTSNKFSLVQCTEPHIIFISYVQTSAVNKTQKTKDLPLFLKTIKHPGTEASSCSLKKLIVWFLWVLQLSHTCHLLLCSHSSPTTTTIGCHLSTSLRCDCQDVFSLSKRLCVLTNKRAPFKPICLSGWGWDSGPLGGAYCPLARGLAGAGLRAESAVERLWREFSGSTVLYNYCTMGQQRLGPNGSGGGQTADTPTPGTKADKQSQRPYYSLSLPLSDSHFWVALNCIHKYSPNLIF